VDELGADRKSLSFQTSLSSSSPGVSASEDREAGSDVSVEGVVGYVRCGESVGQISRGEEERRELI